MSQAQPPSPPSPARPPRGGPPARRGSCRALYAAACAWLLLALAAAAALAWLGSSGGVTWLARRAGIGLQGAQGSLWSGLRARSLQWSDRGTEVQVRHVWLRWRPGALLRRHPLLDFSELRVGGIDIRQAGVPAAAAGRGPPRHLGPPLPLRLQRLRIGRLRLLRAGQARWLDLGSLQGSLHADPRRWQAALHWQAAAGRGTAELRVQAGAPFAVRGRATAELALRQRPLRLQATLGGTLSRLRLRACAQALQARARVSAELRPYASDWLGPTRIDADGLDPQAFEPTLPRAELALRARLLQQPGGPVQGQVSVSNRLAGSLDARRLPLRSLHAALRWSGGALQVDPLRLALDGGGSLDGELDWSPRGAAHLQLQVQRLDLRALYGRLAATRLHGSLLGQADSGGQQLRVALAQPGWRLQARLRREGRRIELRRLRLHAHGASVDLQGSLDTGGARALRVQARIDDLQPQRFGDWPAARLALRLRAQGELGARQLRFALRLLPSRWGERPLQGHAAGALAAGALRDLRADLRLGANTLRVQGGYGRPGQRLRLVLRAPRLAQLGAAWAGALQASATLAGTLAEPSGDLSLQASGLRAPPGLRVRRLRLQARLQPGLRGQLGVRASALGLRLRAWRLQHAALRLQGSLPAQQWQLRLDDPRGLRLLLRARGGWRAGRGWRGVIESLRNRGACALRLRGPASLRILPGWRVSLRELSLHSAGGSVDLRSLRRDSAGWSSRGSARDLDPLYWARLAGLQAPDLRSDLRLRVRWRLRTAPRPALHLAIERSAGDLGVTGAERWPLGLSQLRLRLDGDATDVRVALVAAAARLGRLQAQATLPLVHRATAWRVARHAAISGHAALALTDLHALSAWLPRAVRLGGALQGSVQWSGSLAAPTLQGSLRGTALALALPGLGVDLRRGSLDARLRGEQLQLRSLLLHDAQGGGELQASAVLALAGGLPSGTLSILLQHVQALDRPGQQLRLGGRAQLQARRGRVAIDAGLQIDQASIELASGSAPRLASDVVVQGRARAAARAPALPLQARVRLDLGDRFHVTGYGVDARLGGSLRLRAAAGQPLRAEGSMLVRSGSYSAYGQRLRLVEGGSVNFSGPLDNPGLNLAAQRANLPVQAGVRVTGTLRAPQVALTSTPPMPDDAILSWLVLGQDPATLSADQAPVLQAAAAALLSRGQGASLAGRLAGALGLDELRVGGEGGLQGSVVTLGKKLGSRLSVSVQQGLAATGSLFNVRYRLGRGLSLRLQSGADNALDLFYAFRFD